ncbi:MAG: hypothetical protein ACFCUQ_09475 [Kiloniellales bacterium]
MLYERLDPRFRQYVDSLLAHARQALWPERRAALEGFRRGIARAVDADLQVALRALGDAAPTLDDPADDPATALYRTLLTAYLEQLGESDEISNPDQAALLLQSLDAAQAERARRWLETHPEHAPVAKFSK